MPAIFSRTAHGARHGALRIRGAVLGAAGGPARARVAAILAAVLALNGADQATVSATAENLESAFHIGNTAIGLLVTVATATASRKAVSRTGQRQAANSRQPESRS